MKATIITDLGFGDSGKGTIVDYLSRQQKKTLIVRYNGGAQAAHNVLTPEGVHHTFRNFGSGSLVPGVDTYLSRFFLVDPHAILYEADELARLGVKDILRRITIDQNCIVVTPYHQAMNVLREAARGSNSHGTCGRGIGETVNDSIEHPERTIKVIDLFDTVRIKTLLEQIRLTKLEEFVSMRITDIDWSNARLNDAFNSLNDDTLSENIANYFYAFTSTVRIVTSNHLLNHISDYDHVIFEGAQGVLLDEWYGFHPHTTWSTTTTTNANLLLADAQYDGEVERLGVLRAYSTRHGNGPFVVEDPQMTIDMPDVHNESSGMQGQFRVGPFDLVMARYALSVVSDINSIALTNIDRLYGQPNARMCTDYRSPFVDFEITKIKSSPEPNLGYQSFLTRLLLHCIPDYDVIIDEEVTTKNMFTIIELFAMNLPKPISLISTGPTAMSKARH